MNFVVGQSLLAGLGETLSEFFEGIWISIYTFLINIVYGIFIGISFILDLIQSLFRVLAGLDVYRFYGDTSNTEGDMVIGIITSEAVLNVLYTLAILAIVLLIITTFVAIIRNEYNALEGKTLSITRVIGKSLKSLFNFILVPIVVVFALIISNGLLKSLDMATSPGQSTMMSSKVFVAAAYNCNRARFDDDFLDMLTEVPEAGTYYVMEEEDENGDLVEVQYDTNINHFGMFNNSNTAADEIDIAFGNSYDVPTSSSGSTSTYIYSPNPTGLDELDYVANYDYPEEFSIYNVGLVWTYYNLGSFNFIVAIGVLIGFISVFLETLLGLIKRLYSLAILFMISPLIIALTPVNEDAFKGWKKEFIKDALNAYSVIVTLNLFLMLIPVISTIQFFPIEASYSAARQATLEAFNYIAQLLVLLGGAVFFKDFTKSLGALIGAGSAYDEGSGKAGDFANAVARSVTIGKGMMSPVGMIGKAIGGGFKAMNTARKQSKEEGGNWTKNAVKGIGAGLASPFKNMGGAIKGFFNQTDSNGNKITGGALLKKSKDDLSKAFKTSKFKAAMMPKNVFGKAFKALGEEAKAQKGKERDQKQRDLDTVRHEQLVGAIRGMAGADAQAEEDKAEVAAGGRSVQDKINDYVTPIAEKANTARMSYDASVEELANLKKTGAKSSDIKVKRREIKTAYQAKQAAQKAYTDAVKEGKEHIEWLEKQYGKETHNSVATSKVLSTATQAEQNSRDKQTKFAQKIDKPKL